MLRAPGLLAERDTEGFFNEAKSGFMRLSPLKWGTAGSRPPWELCDEGMNREETRCRTPFFTDWGIESMPGAPASC